MHREHVFGFHRSPSFGSRGILLRPEPITGGIRAVKIVHATSYISKKDGYLDYYTSNRLDLKLSIGNNLLSVPIWTSTQLTLHLQLCAIPCG